MQVSANDPGWAAEPIAWTINREVVLLLSWGPAVLMQVAHPLVAAAIADHSSFMAQRGDRLRRLRQTVAAMLTLSFGTPAEVERTAQTINALHDRIHGHLPEGRGVFPAGSAYSAHDPELLRWVHVTLIDCVLRSYELFVGPLTPAARDRYCVEASTVGPLLGTPDGYFPARLSDLQDQLHATLESEVLAVTAPARAVAHELLGNGASPAAMVMSPLVQLTTVALLPPRLRTAYGLPWDTRRERTFQLMAGAVRCGLGFLPGRARHWPAYRRAASRLASAAGAPLPGVLGVARPRT